MFRFREIPHNLFIEKFLISLGLFSIFLSYFLYQIGHGILSMRLIFASGILCWIILSINHPRFYKDFSKKLTFSICALIFLLAINQFLYLNWLNFFGIYYDPIGTGLLLSILGIGILSSYQTKSFITHLIYFFSVICALTAIPIELNNYGYLGRVGGIFNQSDVLAEVLSLGILIGLQLFSKSTKPYQRVLLYLSETCLTIGLYLSGTRFVLITLILLVLLSVYFLRKQLYKILPLIISLIAIYTFLNFSISFPRISQLSGYAQGFSYRLELQTYAAKRLNHLPFFGVGVGNISNILDCRGMKSIPALNDTCGDNFVFSSSHNIFIDKLLDFGFIFGLIYGLITLYTISKGYKTVEEDNFIYYLVFISIVLYFFSNVSLPEVEILFLIMLFGIHNKQLNNGLRSIN